MPGVSQVTLIPPSCQALPSQYLQLSRPNLLLVAAAGLAGHELPAELLSIQVTFNLSSMVGPIVQVAPPVGTVRYLSAPDSC